MVIAYMKSESHDWIAFGNTEEEAKQAVVSKWNQFFGDDETIETIEYAVECYAVENGKCICFNKDSVTEEMA